MVVKNATIKAAAKAIGLIPAAGYVRMSTDQQADSPERQRREVIAYCERNGYRIVEWYEDHGKTGTESKNRKGFQKLLADAKQGRFEAVIVAELNRMSRENVFAGMRHFEVFADAGVDLITTQRGKIDLKNFGGILQAVVEQHVGHAESVTKSAQSVSGKRAKLAKGERVGGRPPFGYDRELTTDTGEKIIVSFRQKFHKPTTWKTRLVPSKDRGAVKLVRLMFAEVEAGKSIGEITSILNNQSTKPYGQTKWRGSSVSMILRNPTYCGDMAVGHKARGKFNRLVIEQAGVVIRGAHEAIIDRDQFDRIQAILLRRRPNHGKTVTGRHLLTGLLWCADCGCRIKGSYDGARGRRKTAIRAYHCCAVAQFGRGQNKCEKLFNVKATRLEELIVGEILQLLRTDENDRRIGDSLRRTAAKSKPAEVETLEQRLAELRSMVSKGQRNLLEADAEDVPALKAILAEWRQEAAEAESRLQALEQSVRLMPEAAAAIDRLSELFDEIGQDDNRLLAQALSSVVKAIHVGRRTDDGGKPWLYGTIEFQPGVYSKVHRFEVPDIAGMPKFAKVKELLLDSYPRPMSYQKLADALGIPTTFAPSQRHVHVAQIVRRATLRLGGIEKAERGQGWRAVSARKKAKLRPAATA